MDNHDKLIEREQYLIDYFELENLFNSCPKAGSSLGLKRSNESKQKMSNAHKGKKLSQEAKQKVSNAQNRWEYV